MILDPDKVESVLGIHVEGVCKILDCTLGSKFKTIGDSDRMTLNLVHDYSTKNNDGSITKFIILHLRSEMTNIYSDG